jgi:phosphoserine phosphatase RsbU/P
VPETPPDAMRDAPDSSAEIARLNKIIQALMNRAERSTNVQGSDFNLFQTAVMLEEQVRSRTGEVEAALRENEKITRALRESETRIRLLNTQLMASNRKILDSLEYARLIQTALLPLPEMMAEQFLEHFVTFRPRDIVGGDFYMLIPDAEGCLLGVGDCSGHGVPGAFMSMSAGALLKQIVAKVGPEDPALILGEMNAAMKTLLHQGTREVGARQLDNGLDLALVRLPRRGASVRFAGARLSLWIHSPGQEWTAVLGDPQGLGYRRSKTDFPYLTHEVPWAEDAVGYLFSDGVLDQPGGPHGYGVGRARLQKELGLLHGQSVKAQGQALEAFLATYQGSKPQRDDITILGFRPHLSRE